MHWNNRDQGGWGLILVGVVFAAIYGPIIAGLVPDWLNDDNYAHGILVIPIALFFAWERRAQLRELPLNPSWGGAVLVLGSLGVLLLGTAAIEFFLMRISMVGVIAGIVVMLFGWAHLRALLLPIGFLFLMIPLPSLVMNQIAFPLQLIATRLGVSTLEMLNVPVLREGNVIVLASTTLEVAEACSGIRSLMSLLTVSTVYGCLVESRTPIRLLLVVATIPVAIVTNGARVAGIGAAAHYYGPSAAEGFLHGLSGWLLFGVSIAVFLAFGRLVRMFAPPPRPLFASECALSRS